jgi:hypothetical protein
VVVTATRREERLIDVPVSTAVLSGMQLDVLGSAGQDIRQLAFAVPSLKAPTVSCPALTPPSSSPTATTDSLSAVSAPTCRWILAHIDFSYA